MEDFVSVLMLKLCELTNGFVFTYQSPFINLALFVNAFTRYLIRLYAEMYSCIAVICLHLCAVFRFSHECTELCL